MINLNTNPDALYGVTTSKDFTLDGRIFTAEVRNVTDIFLTERDVRVPQDENPWYTYVHVRKQPRFDQEVGDALIPVDEMVKIISEKTYEIY